MLIVVQEQAVTGSEPIVCAMDNIGCQQTQFSEYCAALVFQHPHSMRSATPSCIMDPQTVLRLPFLLCAVDSMRPHFADAANSTGYGTTMTLSALRSYLGRKGIDTQTWWLGVQTTILQVRWPVLTQ